MARDRAGFAAPLHTIETPPTNQGVAQPFALTVGRSTDPTPPAPASMRRTFPGTTTSAPARRSCPMAPRRPNVRHVGDTRAAVRRPVPGQSTRQITVSATWTSFTAPWTCVTYVRALR